MKLLAGKGSKVFQKEVDKDLTQEKCLWWLVESTSPLEDFLGTEANTINSVTFIHSTYLYRIYMSLLLWPS